MRRPGSGCLAAPIESGEYQNVSEAVRVALQQRRRSDALRREGLRLHIKAGIDALERRDFADIDDSDLDDYFPDPSRSGRPGPEYG